MFSEFYGIEVELVVHLLLVRWHCAMSVSAWVVGVEFVMINVSSVSALHQESIYFYMGLLSMRCVDEVTVTCSEELAPSYMPVFTSCRCLR